jgi:hypothetical protein
MPALALQGSAMALAAVMFICSLIPFGSGPEVEISGHQGNTFWGAIMVDGQQSPLMVEVDVPSGGTKKQTNKPQNKPEKHPKEEKEPEPPTPGKVKITFQKKGEDIRIEYNRDMGAGDMSEEDKDRIDKVIDAVLKYSEQATVKQTVGRRVLEFLKNVKVRPAPIFFKGW